jgi:hypothetical protein
MRNDGVFGVEPPSGDLVRIIILLAKEVAEICFPKRNVR